MEQVMETVRETGSRVLDALCETGKAVVGFFTGLVKYVSCSAAKLVKDSTCKAAGCTWDGQTGRQGISPGPADCGGRRVSGACGHGGGVFLSGQEKMIPRAKTHHA